MKAFQALGLQQFNAQTQDKDLAAVTELSFSQGAISNELLAEKFTKLSNLTRLTCVDMKINDAQFPHLLSAFKASGAIDKLRALDFCDNKLTKFSSEDKFPALVRLILCNNKIESVADLGMSAERFPSLRTLDVEDNGCEKAAADTSGGVWASCPSLVIVNGKDRSGDEAHDPSDAEDDDDEDEEEGDDKDLSDSDFVDSQDEMDGGSSGDDDSSSSGGDDVRKEGAGQRRDRDE